MSMAKAAKLRQGCQGSGKTNGEDWQVLYSSALVASPLPLPGSLLGTMVEVRDGFIVRSYLSNTVRALRAGQALDQSGTNSLS